MLLVDFGESACKFALVKEHGKNLEVQKWGVEDIRSLEYATEHVLEEVKGIDIDTVLLGLPSTLWRSRILHERIERKNTALRIDLAEKKAILDDLFSRARVSLAKHVQDSSGILPEDVHIHKLQILTYAIDGYQVEDILGFEGQHMDVHIMAVFALVKHLPIVDNIIQRFSHMSCRIIHPAEALGSFSQEKSQNAIYVDIGDASCRIAVTQGGRVAFVDEVGRGGKDFTLYLQEALSLGENTAKDFKERYASGDFSFPLREEVKKGFALIAEDLVRLVDRSLVSASMLLPPSILLFGGSSKLPEVKEAFESSSFEGLAFHEKPRISFLLPEDLWTMEFPGKTNPIFTTLFFLPYAPYHYVNPISYNVENNMEAGIDDLRELRNFNKKLTQYDLENRTGLM